MLKIKRVALGGVMKNLKDELDILEVKLAQLTNEEVTPRLAKTKFIVEKNGPVTESEEALRSKIADVKKQLAARKIHHYTTQISRHLKIFKRQEPQKIQKRIKKAPAKQQQLEQEIAVVKDLDLNEYASLIVNNFLVKQFGEPFTVDKGSMDGPAANVFGRACALKAVKEDLQRLDEILVEWYERSSGALEKEKLKLEEKAKKEEAERERRKEERKRDLEKRLEGEQEGLKEIKKAQKQEIAERRQDRVQRDSNEETPGSALSEENEEIEDNEESEENEENEESERNEESEHGSSDEGFFETTEGGDLPELPQLYNGYVSGSESEPEMDVEELKPQRKNRRGQRARRRIWELKYGTRANHIIKERTEHAKEAREKEAKRQEKMRKHALQMEYEREKQAKRQALESKPLHPSWQARIEQQKKQKIVPVTGKKIKFD